MASTDGRGGRRRLPALLAIMLIAVGGAVAATALAQDGATDNDTNDTNLTIGDNLTDNLTDNATDNLTDADNLTLDDNLTDGEDADFEDEQEVLVAEVDDIEVVNSTFDNDTGELTFVMDVFLEADERTQEELNETEPGENITVSDGAANVTLGDATLVDAGTANETGENVVRIEVTLENVDPTQLGDGGPGFEVPVGPPGEPGERGQGQGQGQGDGPQAALNLTNDTNDTNATNLTDDSDNLTGNES